MRGIILELRMNPLKTEYDLRYFSFDENSTGHATCGIAYMTLMSIYRQFKGTMSSMITDWYTAISNSSNPSVTGYLAEYVCLAAIERGGLGGYNAELGNQLKMEPFDDVPPLATVSDNNRADRLYVPNAFNYSNIDGAIVRLDFDAKKARVYLIQVTIAKSHKDSEQDFYLKQWGKWKAVLESNGYQASSEFIWVGLWKSDTKVVAGQGRPTRQEPDRITVDPHTTSRVSVETLDKQLDTLLTEKGFYRK